MELKKWRLGLFRHEHCSLLTITHPYTISLCFHQALLIHLSAHETLGEARINSGVELWRS